MLAHAALEAIGQQLQHSIDVPVTERIVSFRDCGAEVASGWFQTCERRALACAMDADEHLKEISVRELAGFRAQFPNRLSVVKGPLDLCFVRLLDPDEDEIYLPRFERLLRGFDDWTVKSVTMCTYVTPRARSAR